MRFALETNTLKARFRTSATHIQSYNVATCTSDFQTELMSRCSLVTATDLQKQALSCCGYPKVSRCTTMSSTALNWPYYWQLPAIKCGLTICAIPGIRNQKPQKLKNVSILHTGGPFLCSSLPLIARTTPQTRKGKYPVIEQSFGMYNIYVHCIVFELCVTEKERRRKKTNKINIFACGFLSLVKG